MLPGHLGITWLTHWQLTSKQSFRALIEYLHADLSYLLQMSVPEKNHRSGLVVYYENVQQTEDAAVAFRSAAAANPETYSFNGQPIRAQPDFTYTLSFHKAIFDSRQADFAEVARLAVQCMHSSI